MALLDAWALSEAIKRFPVKEGCPPMRVLGEGMFSPTNLYLLRSHHSISLTVDSYPRSAIAYCIRYR